MAEVAQREASPEKTIASLKARVATLEAELAAHRLRLHGLQDISGAVSSTLNLNRLLNMIMDKLTELMDADRSTLWLIDRESDELWSRVAQGEGEGEGSIRIPLTGGLAGWVASTGQSLNLKDAYKDPRFNNRIDQETGYRTRSMLCMPMRNHRGETIGVVQVLNKSCGYFTMDDEALLSTLSSQAAISIENSKLYVSLTSKNIELMIAHEQLQQRVAEIDLLFHIEQEMNRQVALDGFLHSLLCRARDTIAAEAGVALIREGSRWRVFSHHGDGDDALILRSWPDGTDGRLVELATRAEGYLQNDIEEVFDPRLGEILDVPIRSVLLVPLEIAGQRLGAILLINKAGIPRGVFDEADRKMLTVIGGRAEVAIVLAQQRAEELNQSRLSAIGQALSGVLHDLKTPMTIIGGYTQLMVDEDDPEERADYAQIVSRQLKQLKGMTQEILAFARGESSLLVRKVFLHSFIPEVVAGLEEEMRGRDITVETALGYRDGIRLDVGKMQRVLFNLARNARQAMEDQEGPRRFRIETALDEAKDEVVLTLSDTGPGIPDDIVDTLFDSFVTSGKKDGTGLGLAIVKKIVEQHGGTVGFRSKSGQGTTFEIRLPRNM